MAGGFDTLLTCQGCGLRAHRALTRVGAGQKRRFLCDDCIAIGDAPSGPVIESSLRAERP